MKLFLKKIRAKFYDWLDIPDWRLDDMYKEYQAEVIEKDVDMYINWLQNKGVLEDDKARRA